MFSHVYGNNRVDVTENIRIKLQFERVLASGVTMGDVLHPKFENPPGRFRTFGHIVFWDLDNTADFVSHRSGYNFHTLRSRIQKALQHMNERNFVARVIGFGNLKIFTAAEYEIMRKNDIELRHVAKRSVLCDKCRHVAKRSVLCDKCIAEEEVSGDRYQRPSDRADNLLIESMLLFASDVGPPSCITVISGDADFATPIAQLKHEGHHMVTSVLQHSSDFLKNSGDVCFVDSAIFQGRYPTISEYVVGFGKKR